MDSLLDDDLKYSKRTRVACELCRRKKIKCSGGQPCANCIQLKELECKYIEKIRKKPKERIGVNKKTTNAQAIGIMEDRLSRLEGFISNISSKLDHIANVPTKRAMPIRKDYSPPNVSDSTSYFDDDEKDDTDVKDDEPDNEDDVASRTSSSDDKDTKKYGDTVRLLELLESLRDGKPPSGRDKEALMSQTIKEEFFESHSFLSVFSRKSLEWIKSSISPDKLHLIRQFNNFPYYYLYRARKLIRKFIEPVLVTAENKRRLVTRPIPEDPEFILALFDQYAHYFKLLGMIVDLKECRKILEGYYHNKQPSNSVCLVLCSLFYLLLEMMMDKKSSKLSNNNCKLMKPELSQKYTNKELSAMRDNLLDSCVLLYHRICVIGEGIQSIQGILMLVLALETTAVADCSYMLLSTAIRYGQEMGMHRPESYLRLDPKEAETRKSIWCSCEAFDIEFSFRNGKPPILIGMDNFIVRSDDFMNLVAKLKNDGLNSYSSEFMFNRSSQTLEFSNETIEHCYNSGNFDLILIYTKYLLSRIRAKSYNKLFVSVGNFQTIENLETLLDELNMDALKIAQTLCHEFKPRFYDEPGFGYNMNINDYSTHLQLLNNHLVFFFQLMLTNRIPFMIDINSEDNKTATFRKIHVRSARTILHIAMQMDIQGMPNLTQGWLTFYPFAAFLMLLSVCMNNPFKPETKDDIKLLSKVSDLYFGALDVINEGATLKKSTMFVIIMKLFIELVVAVIENKIQETITLGETHKKQMKSLKHKSPELFINRLEMFDVHFQSAYDEKEVLGSSTKGDSTSISMCNTPNHSTNNITIPSVAEQVNSPSYNPALANLMHPSESLPKMHQMNQTFVESSASSDTTAKPSPDFLAENFDLNNDPIGNIINFQVNELPNFFFDNNLGF